MRIGMIWDGHPASVDETVEQPARSAGSFRRVLQELQDRAWQPSGIAGIEVMMAGSSPTMTKEARARTRDYQ